MPAIDVGSNQLAIVRRADEKDDTRTRQPNAKTLSQHLPLDDVLAKQLHDYIIHERHKVPNAKFHVYLIVMHKEGPTQWQPISKVAYHKVIGLVRAVSPQLYAMSGYLHVAAYLEPADL